MPIHFLEVEAFATGMGSGKLEGVQGKTSWRTNCWATFHILSTTLLSLLLPLSLVLLARFSFLTELSAMQSTSPLLSSRLHILFLEYFDGPFLYATIATVSLATLCRELACGVCVSMEEQETIKQPNLGIAWTFLIMLQFCVGLGVGGSLSVDNNWYTFSTNRGSGWGMAPFLLGLHEATLFWSKNVVKPVVDDTIYGEPREEGWVYRGAMTASFGGLWWLLLRREVELLAFLGGTKNNALPEMIVSWLYYVAIAIGVMRFLRLITFPGVMFLLGRSAFGNQQCPSTLLKQNSK